MVARMDTESLFIDPVFERYVWLKDVSGVSGGVEKMALSEVAAFREQIAIEYLAAKNVFIGFTPTARHDFINKQQENIGQYFENLKQYMSGEEAFALLLQVENEVDNLRPSSGGTDDRI